MRCFVAIDPPDEVRLAIGAVQTGLRRAAARADVRWVETAALHLTLKFLGEVAEERIAGVVGAVGAAAARVAPLALTVAGLGAFPAPRRARVVWVGISAGAPALAGLAGRVEQALGALGFPAEMRPWSPHLTVGRVRSPRGLGPLAAAIEDAPPTPLGAWLAREIVIYRSHLQATGAVHEALARVPLAGADA